MQITLVGHSTGSGEVARYIGRHGTRRVAKAVLIAAVPPLMVKSARLIRGAKTIYYPGAPHGLTATHQDQVNADLLAFLKSRAQFPAPGGFAERRAPSFQLA